MKKGITQHGNGFTVRTKNKSITVFENDKGKTCVHIMAALDKEELHFNGNDILRGKVKRTVFGLTDQAAMSLHYALTMFLRKKQTDNHLTKPH